MRISDRDIQPLMYGEEGAQTEHDACFYYKRNVLEAVRSGPWKLHIRREAPRDGNQTVQGKDRPIIEVQELYNLDSDIGESDNVYDQHPAVVDDLTAKAEACRQDIGDSSVGVEGANIRPAGRVDNPDTLTHLDQDHPYMIAMFELKERG